MPVPAIHRSVLLFISLQTPTNVQLLLLCIHSPLHLPDTPPATSHHLPLFCDSKQQLLHCQQQRAPSPHMCLMRLSWPTTHTSTETTTRQLHELCRNRTWKRTLYAIFSMRCQKQSLPPSLPLALSLSSTHILSLSPSLSLHHRLHALPEANLRLRQGAQVVHHQKVVQALVERRFELLCAHIRH